MTNVNDVANIILATMQEYTLEVEENIPQAVDDTVDNLLEQIKRDSPKRTGAYAKGWTARRMGDRVRSAEGYAKLICNPRYYYLAHLLEHGHAKRKGGRVSGKPHIQPAIDKHLPEFEQKIKEVLKR